MDMQEILNWDNRKIAEKVPNLYYMLFLFGDAAIGKMTVGQELIKITGLRLCLPYTR
jgi:hypothetical protein